MCDTDGLQTTVHLGPVKRAGQDLSASLTLALILPMPDQDEHLPDLLEAAVHAAGLEVQRRLFAALIEKADRELILDLRDGKGGQGIQRRGTRPFTFKTIDRAVMVWEKSADNTWQHGSVAPANYLDWRDQKMDGRRKSRGFGSFGRRSMPVSPSSTPPTSTVSTSATSDTTSA